MTPYPVRILEEAEAELFAEYDWYRDNAGQDVADRFRELIRLKIHRITPLVYGICTWRAPCGGG